MKQMLLAGAAVVALSSPAFADLQIGVSEDGGAFVFSPISTTGSISFSPTLANFANVTINSTGVPIEETPDLATTDLSAENTTAATHTLNVEVFQTNISATGATLRSSFTVNNLIGTGLTPGDSVLSDFINGSGTTLGTPLHSQDFPAGTLDNGVVQGPSGPFNVTADAHELVVTFNSGQTITDTVQTIGVGPVGVPEPSTLAIIGAALVSLGLLRKWNIGSRA